jgi:CubicO group peptidase (beta-lactamase class C family)
MRKLIIPIVLAICLLTGCFAFDTPAIPLERLPEQPAAFLPDESAAPAPGGVPVITPPPEEGETVQPAPDETESSAPVEQVLLPAPPPPVELPKLIDGFFAEYPEFSGSVLIARGNRIIFCKGYGMANAETGAENTPDTKFLVGSVTKQFTSMAVMQLYEKGLLDINDKLSKYIPDFTRGGEITLWNLLTNTSGIVDFLNDYPPIISSIPYEEVSQRRLIDLIKTQPLKFKPGEKYSYSNSNFLILGYIVEKVSGMSYGDYLAQNIFEPLGMENTGIMSIGSPPENMARGHTRPGVPVRYYTAGGEIIDDTANSVKGAYGAGRLYSTVGDLWIWDRALKTEKLISKEYIDMMFYPHVPVPNAVPECSYGFGWVIDSDPDVGTIIRHTGTLSGFRAYNGILADRGFIVIVLFNTKEFSGREAIIPSLKKILPVSSISKQSQENPPVV